MIVCSHNNAEFWHVIIFADVAVIVSVGVILKVLEFLLSANMVFVDALLGCSLLETLAAAFFLQY